MFAEITEYWYGTLIDIKTIAVKENVRICTISFPFHISGTLFLWKFRNIIQISQDK
jgi:hypothetical protein